MESQEIRLSDWSRIIEGLTPHVFLIEVVIRMIFAYALLLVSVRFMGNRMASDLSKVDLITRVCLAAAIGMPLQAPDRGILPTVVVIVVAVLAERIISSIAVKNRRFELMTQDSYDILVADAVLQIDNMRKTKVTRERLFAQLRSLQIKHLGQVKRVFFEANGVFTLIENEKPTEGLSIIPDWDQEMRNRHTLGQKEVCKFCGCAKEEHDTCSSCGKENWEKAVIK